MPEVGHFAAFQRPVLEDLRGFLPQTREGS
jgi:hypothetical protein